MFATLVKATLVSLAVQGALAEFRLDTPTELVQCQPVRLTWESTNSAPYNMAVVPGNNPCGDVLLDLGDHDGTSMTWTVALKAGTLVSFSLLDAEDDDAWSGALTVQPSDDDSCLPEAERDTPSSSAAPTSSTVAATGTTGRTTLVATTPATTPRTTTTAQTGSATPVGAANAGDLPNPFGNGASSVRLPGAVTALGAIAAIVAAMTF